MFALRSARAVLRSATAAPLLRVQAAARPTLTRGFQSSRASASLFSEYVDKVRTTVPEKTTAELHDLLAHVPHRVAPQITLIDVRETYEWNEEHIPGAIYLGRGCLERDIEAVVPELDDLVVLYCAGGVRSLLAAESLRRMGYTNVYSLKGGMGAWIRSGYEVAENTTNYCDRVDYVRNNTYTRAH